MITFRCTKKMLKQLRVAKSDLVGADDPPGSVLGSWYVNLFHIDRRKCVLFTNDRTLYSVLLHGLLKPDFDDLGRRFVTGLTANLRREGFPAEKIAALGMACYPVAFGTTQSRRVLGYMNEHIHVAKYIAALQHQPIEQEILQLNHTINDTPMKSLPTGYALKEMRVTLANWTPSADFEK